MSKRTIVIAGGGTGGHIYPAVAIAQSLKSIDPSLEIHFVGTKKGLETKIVPREGWPLHTIESGQLNYKGSKFQKLLTLLKLPKSFAQSFSLLFELQPLVVVGVGGYASGPFVLTAAVLGFRTVLWEPNAIPGMTNRWLSRFVKKCFVVFEEARKHLKSKSIEVVGLPVRAEIEKSILQATQNMNSQNAIPGDSQSPQRPFKILIFGGSQGARAINQAISQIVTENPEWRKDILIRHQTGVHDFAEISQKYEGLTGVVALEYLHDMPEQYAWADLVICRSGASTVAELAACGKAAILIPYPAAADNHQLKNAEALANEQAAILIEQKNLNPETLRKKIEELKNDRQQLVRCSAKIKIFYQPHSANFLANKIIEMIGN